VEAVALAEVDELTSELRSAMWRYVGIVRTSERLGRALDLIRDIRAQADALYATGKLSPQFLELRNMALTAELVILSAQSRKESRGLHYNLDYPELDDERFKHDTLLIQNGEQAPELIRTE